jgi:hypothetical protein
MVMIENCVIARCYMYLRNVEMVLWKRRTCWANAGLVESINCVIVIDEEVHYTLNHFRLAP